MRPRNVVLSVIGGLFALFALMWLVQGNQFFMYKFFAPKKEAIRREVFEQTKSYRQGMIHELQNMQFEYIKADDLQKPALADIILHRSADFPREDLPADLRSFIDNLKREKATAR